MSTAQYVTLVLDLADARGIVPQRGAAIIIPSGQIPDPNDGLLIGEPVTVDFSASPSSPPSVRLVSTDSVGPQPNGWTYTISYVGALVAGFQPFSFHLPVANGATQNLSALASAPATVPGLSYLPLPTGTPTAGYVPAVVTNGSPQTQWVPNGTGGGVASFNGRTGAVTPQSGDYSVGQVSGAAPLASPALTGTPTAPTAAGGTSTTQLATTAFATSAANAAQAASYPEAGGAVNGPVSPKGAITLSQSGGTVAIDATQGNVFVLTVTASGWTISAPTGGLDGQVIRLRLIQGTGGNFTVTFASGWNFGAAGAPTLSTAAGKRDRIVAEYVAAGGTTAPCWDAAADLGH